MANNYSNYNYGSRGVEEGITLPWFIWPIIVIGLAAGAVFTGVVGTLGASFVWENGFHYALFSLLGLATGDLPEGPTTPDLEWPTWIVYSAVPLGSYLMCFRFLQVAVGFVRTGELPHHDHGHVEGLEDEAQKPEDINWFTADEELHPRDLKSPAPPREDSRRKDGGQ